MNRECLRFGREVCADLEAALCREWLETNEPLKANASTLSRADMIVFQ